MCPHTSCSNRNLSEHSSIQVFKMQYSGLPVVTKVEISHKELKSKHAQQSAKPNLSNEVTAPTMCITATTTYVSLLRNPV